jgi:hypothetical protein
LFLSLAAVVRRAELRAFTAGRCAAAVGICRQRKSNEIVADHRRRHDERARERDDPNAIHGLIVLRGWRRVKLARFCGIESLSVAQRNVSRCVRGIESLRPPAAELEM